MLEAYASGVTWHADFGPVRLGSTPAIWLYDADGRWHVTRVSVGSSVTAGETTMRLTVAPPLRPGTAWVEVLAAGLSEQVRLRLPLRWL